MLILRCYYTYTDMYTWCIPLFCMFSFTSILFISNDFQTDFYLMNVRDSLLLDSLFPILQFLTILIFLIKYRTMIKLLNFIKRYFIKINVKLFPYANEKRSDVFQMAEKSK